MIKALFIFVFFSTLSWADKQPNVIIILTDDQGYGDFGCKGNPIVQTPNIDAMASRSFEMQRFYVSPVCSPTRASLMTGRDFYRTGVTDTFKGRSIMRTEEVTLAEILKESGYATGLFGKWHLGDNYPFRPMDQGFDHALYHMGGGLGQPSEPKENARRYTDAILFENGQKKATKGFCCDVYFDEAIEWFKTQNKNDKPFFAYIASNTPHSPYHDVPQKWLDVYSKLDLSPKNFPQSKGHSISDQRFNQDTLARIYAMVSNIDENVGKLFEELEKEKLMEDTIVIFFNDNGPNTLRYVGGFADKKGSHKEGGIRSPIWWHWPAKLKAGQSSDLVTAHIDIMPTLAEFCGAKMPQHKTIDGRSIAPTLLGGKQQWDQRSIFLQWHRGERPEALNNTAIVQQNWKIESNGGQPTLYNLNKDPYAMRDVSLKYPEKKSQLLQTYQNWLKNLDREYPDMWQPLRIVIDHQKEPELILSRQEMWNDAWYLKLKNASDYNISFNVSEDLPVVEAEVRINEKILFSNELNIKNGKYHLPKMTLPKGNISLQVKLNVPPKKSKLWHVFLDKI
jgi:arylsulfatase/arylsulfatase A